MESRAKTEEFEFRNLKENLNFKPQFWSHTWDLVKPTLTYDQVLEMPIKLTSIVLTSGVPWTVMLEVVIQEGKKSKHTAYNQGADAGRKAK